MSEDFTDLVLGGGAAGCVVASRLSSDSARRVCLVEAGPDYGTLAHGKWPQDLLNARRITDSHDWPRGRGDACSTAKVIGGSTSHNACALVAGSREDYDEWSPWSYQALRPYLDSVENKLGLLTHPTDGLSPFHKAAIEGAEQSGMERLHSVNDLDMTVGFAPILLNVQGTTRMNASFMYLDEARGRPNLTIKPMTSADRLIVHDGRCVGAIASGRPIYAERTVLCAGSYGSAGILLRSGVGPTDDLEKHGIDVLVDSPVGQNLVDHPGVSVEWKFHGKIAAQLLDYSRDNEFFEGQVLIRARSEACELDTWDLHIYPRLSSSRRDGSLRTTATIYALKPRSRGKVQLSSSDPLEPLLVSNHFLEEATDRTTIESGIRQAQAIMPSDFTPSRPSVGEDISTYVTENTTSFFHPVGTCALGTVVDHSGQVMGLPGVFVADASVMPTIPRANTALSVFAVAEMIAKGLTVAE